MKESLITVLNKDSFLPSPEIWSWAGLDLGRHRWTSNHDQSIRIAGNLSGRDLCVSIGDLVTVGVLCYKVVGYSRRREGYLSLKRI